MVEKEELFNILYKNLYYDIDNDITNPKIIIFLEQKITDEITPEIKELLHEKIRIVISNTCLINEIKKDSGTSIEYIYLLSKYLLNIFYANYETIIGKIPNEYFKIENNNTRKTEVLNFFEKLSNSLIINRYNITNNYYYDLLINYDLNILEKQNYLFIPCVFKTNTALHAISFIIKKVDEDNYTIYYLNEGNASNYFYSDINKKVNG